MSQFPGDRTLITLPTRNPQAGLTTHTGLAQTADAAPQDAAAGQRANQADRRVHTRYAHGGLTVDLHKPGLRGVLGRPEATQCIDFSVTGLQVCCGRTLNAGDRVVVDLRLYELHIDELECTVCSARPFIRQGSLQGATQSATPGATDQYLYGLQFSFSRGRFMRSEQVGNALRRIGFALKQNATYL